jgi:hypothetical protein
MEAELQIFIARKMKVLHSLECNLDAILAKRELFFNISIILPYFLHISSCITCNNCFTINSYKISNLIFVKKRILWKTNLLCSLYDSFLCSDSTIIHWRYLWWLCDVKWWYWRWLWSFHQSGPKITNYIEKIRQIPILFPTAESV